MRYFPPLSAIAAGALFTVAGCSAAGTSAIAPSAAQPAAAQAAAFSHAHGRPLATPGHGYVYVADYFGGAVWIFPAKGADPSPVGSITNGIDGPQGMAIDSAGNLYVTDTGNASVTVYPPGASTPSLTLTQDMVTPAEVAVDSKNNVWVSNEDGNYSGSVVEFPAGSSTPSTVISGIFPHGVAVDSQGNLFVATNTYNYGAFVAVYPPGATKPSKEFGQAELTVPNGVLVAPNGDIEVADAYRSEIYIYAHKTYKLRRKVYVAGNDPGLTLAQNKRLYVALGLYDIGVVNEVSHDGHGRVLKDELTKNLKSSTGVAADPEVAPGP